MLRRSDSLPLAESNWP